MLISFVTYSQITLTYSSNDLATWNATVNKWEKYWNTHDMDSVGTLLREDVDFVNVAGIGIKALALKQVFGKLIVLKLNI